MWAPTKYMFIQNILYTYVQLVSNCCQLAREHIEGMLICCLEWLGSMFYFLLCLTGLIKPHQLKAVFVAFLVARKLAASPTFVHGLPFCCVRNAPRLELFPSEIYRLKAKQLMKVKWWNDLSYSTSQGVFLVFWSWCGFMMCQLHFENLRDLEWNCKMCCSKSVDSRSLDMFWIKLSKNSSDSSHEGSRFDLVYVCKSCCI